MAATSINNIRTALIGILLLSACTHRSVTPASRLAVQPLARRIDALAEPKDDPGRAPHQLTLDSARALAAVPTQLSLGEWRPIGPWTYAGKAFDVAVNPVDPNTVYAAFGVGGGLWKTSDGGQTWLQLTDRSDLTGIGCVSVHPNLPDVVVACIGGPGNPSARRGLIYSTDAGRHFDYIGPSDGLSTSFYRAIFDPNDPNIIYTASEAGVYRTTDRGATWNLSLTFPGSNPDDYSHLPDLAIKPDNPSVLIAAQVNLGVFRTANRGATWSRADQGMDASTETSVLAWSPSDPNTVYCERNNRDGQHMITYASSDAGITWSESANLAFYHQDRYDMALAVDPTNPSRVMLANGYFGISTDGLRTYNGYNNYGLHADHLRVVFAPSNPRIVFDANDGGIWRSIDAGGTWARIDVGVNTNISFGFDVNTVSGQIYLSPADYGSFQFTPAAGWNNSPEGGEWAKFYIDPYDSATVWYAAFNSLAVSHDSGQTWKNVDPDPAGLRPYRTVLRFSPSKKGTLFFLTYTKMWVTHDGGITWADTGLRSSSHVFTDMVFDLAQPGAAYVTENGGVFASSDGGTTWTENQSSTWGLPYNNQIMAPVPGSAGEFYMNAEGGMYLMSKGGQETQSLSAAPFNDVPINDLATDPAHPERVYAGTAAGLFISQDYGHSWQRLGRNLPLTNIWQISVNGSTLYAGTSQGIWEFSSDISWQQPLPVNLAVKATSTSSITLSWTSGSNSTGVRIFRNGVQTYVGQENNYTDLELIPATNYCYTILDSNASGEGPLSSPLCVNTAAVTGGLPSVAVSASNLQFDYTLGNDLPGGLAVQITNGGTGVAAWTASANVPWLSIKPLTGNAPATIAIEVTSAAKLFTVGKYTGTVSIAQDGVSSQSISVTLNVNPSPPPQMSVSSFGTNDAFSSNGWCVSGDSTTNCGPAVTRYIAAPFVPSNTFSVSNITLAIGINSGTNGAVINLMSARGGLPGAVLESWRVSNLPNAVVISVSSKLNPVLQTGQTYWLEVEPLAADTLAFWFTNNLGLSGGLTNVNQSGWTDLAGYAGQTLPVFSVSGPTSAVSITSGGIVPVDSPVNVIQPGEWVSIYGTNLASSTVSWSGNFPTSLAGTSVTIDGKAAYLSFASPAQINLQAPDDSSTGTVSVVVTTASGTAASTVTIAKFAPSFLLLDGKHVAAIILRPDGSGAYGGGTYDLLGPTGNSLGYPTVAAKRGDSVVLFAVGLGPTSPAVAPGQVFSGAAPTTNAVDLLVNNVSLIPIFSGLSGAGLYQINVTVSAGLGSGDVPLVAIVGGAQTPPNVVISLQ